MHSHQSLGAVERFHRTIQEEIRVLRLEVEKRGKFVVKLEDPLVTWLVHHAGWLLMRFHVPRPLGHTPFYHVRGANYAGGLAYFGEVVLGRFPDDLSAGGRHASKWASRWQPGVCLGRT